MKKTLLPLVLLAALCAAALRPCQAATTNFSEAVPGVQTIALTWGSQLTADTVWKFTLPFKAELLSVTASADTIDRTTTDETYKIDVAEGGTSVLSAVIDILAADTVYSGTVSDAALADEAAITVTLDVGGTTPIVTGGCVLLTVRRTN